MSIGVGRLSAFVLNRKIKTCEVDIFKAPMASGDDERAGPVRGLQEYEEVDVGVAEG